MLVLGIDPGLSRCGYSAILQGSQPRAMAAGVITTDAQAETPIRLAELQTEIRDFIGELQPEVVAVERLLFQHNIRTAVSVAQAMGVVMAEAVAAGCAVFEYSPNEVKLAVAGYGSAGKEEVAVMVKHLLALKHQLRPADAADAAAVALCHLARLPSRVTRSRVTR
ncbi:MAG: crossover junction endodeoxyribonuclease RuvC [Acidimicrobiaceae bacterium]|nr:crossover junction endodeoxyribonuclease RuvC [Acidimicrobiaceae bacterium]